MHTNRSVLDDPRLTSFIDELEKISATVLQKPLSDAAKRFMQRMTGFTGATELAANRSARQLRHHLTGSAAPALMTEMHGMGNLGLLSASESAAKRQAVQHYQGVLQGLGKSVKGAPGTEQALNSIAGHPRVLTRSGAVMQGATASRPLGAVAGMSGAAEGTVAGKLAPRPVGAVAGQAGAAEGTVAGKVLRPQRPSGSLVRGPVSPYAPTVMAPVM